MIQDHLVALIRLLSMSPWLIVSLHGKQYNSQSKHVNFVRIIVISIYNLGSHVIFRAKLGACLIAWLVCLSKAPVDNFWIKLCI